MLPQVPEVSLVAGQAGAVDAALLAGAHADSLAVHRVADGVGLGVFEGDEGHQQVQLVLPGEGLVLRHQVGEEGLVDLEVVAALFKGDAVDLLDLLGSGDIVRVDGHHVVAALALGLEDFQRLVGVAGGDDAVGDLPLDELGRGRVTDVAQGDPVAEGTHPVGASGPGIGAGQRGFVQSLHVVHEAGLFQRRGQGTAQCGGGGAHVLEGGGADHAGGGLQLLDQLIAVEGVQEVDIAGPSVEDGDGQLTAVGHVDFSGLLIGVAAVLQFKFLHDTQSFPNLLMRRLSYRPVTGSV